MKEGGQNSPVLYGLPPKSPTSDLEFLEDIHSALAAIMEAPSKDSRQAARVILTRIIERDGSFDGSAGRTAQASLNNLAAALCFSEKTTNLWSKILIEIGLADNLEPLASAEDESRQISIPDLREIVNSYTKRKYIALNIFKHSVFPKIPDGSVKLFSPMVDYVFSERDSTHIGVTLGVAVVAKAGLPFELKGRIRLRGGKENETKSPVATIFKTISILNSSFGEVIDDSRRLEFSLLSPPGESGPYDLELIVLGPTGDVIERLNLSLPTELRPVNFGLVNELKRNDNPIPVKSEKSDRRVTKVTLPSQILDLSLRSEGKSLILHYQLNLQGGQSYNAVIEMLDEEGHPIRVSSLRSRLFYFDDKKFEQLERGVLTFKRNLDLTKLEGVKLEEDLVLPRRAFGFGFWSREIFISYFLFDSRHNKIDEVEQGFLVSVRPGSLRVLQNLWASFCSFGMNLLKDFLFKGLSTTSRTTSKFGDHNSGQ
jgi:hypothetical protein